MKAGWEVKQLGDIAQVKGGKRVPKGYKLSSEPTDFPYLRVTDFANDGTIDMSGLRYVSAEVHREIKNYVIFSDDLYISIAGTIGKTGIIPEELDGANLTENACRLVFLPGISNRFIYYFTSSSTFIEQAGLNTRTTAQPKLALERLKTILLPVPPLPEQQRIVAILDEAFDSIAIAKANAEKNLQNARALFESHLQAVFSQRGEGWVEKKLEQIGTTQTGSTPKTSEQDNYGNHIPFIKPADFNRDGSLDYDNDGLSEKGLATARLIKSGSVLMVCIGATIGKCGWNECDVTSNQQINAFTPVDSVSHKFIYYQMLTEDFQRRVLQNSGQATLPIINKSKWSALSVALPPKLSEQERIADQFDALMIEVQRLESIYQQKLAALDALKKSLLDQAFRGEL